MKRTVFEEPEFQVIWFRASDAMCNCDSGDVDDDPTNAEQENFG